MNNSNSSVLIVDDDAIHIVLSLIRCLGIAKIKNIHVLSLAGKKSSVLGYSKYVKTYTALKAHDEEEAFSIICDTAKKVNADLVVPVRERTIRIIIKNRDELCFTKISPIPDARTMELVCNKWMLSNWLFDHNFLNERPLKFNEVITDKNGHSALKFPCLIKPFQGTSGVGITQINNIAELQSFKLSTVYKPEEILIQRLFPGYDIDFSAVVDNGEIVAYAIQMGIQKKKKHTYSKYIKFIENKQLYELASSIFKELKYSGIAHLDFRYDQGDKMYKLIDFNPRFWSSLLGSLNAGVNFPRISTDIALQKNVSQSNIKHKKYYATNNVFKLIFNGVSLRNAELYYTLIDPIPYLISYGKMFLRYVIKTNVAGIFIVKLLNWNCCDIYNFWSIEAIEFSCCGYTISPYFIGY